MERHELLRRARAARRPFDANEGRRLAERSNLVQRTRKLARLRWETLDDPLPVKQVAFVLGVRENAVYKMLHRGDLPFHRGRPGLRPGRPPHYVWQADLKDLLANWLRQLRA